jgi:hypothetical protein
MALELAEILCIGSFFVVSLQRLIFLGVFTQIVHLQLNIIVGFILGNVADSKFVLFTIVIFIT